MGESKRRRSLDPSYGKPTISSSPQQAYLDIIGHSVNLITEKKLTAIVVDTPKGCYIYSKKCLADEDVFIVDYKSEKKVSTDQLKNILQGAKLVAQIR